MNMKVSREEQDRVDALKKEREANRLQHIEYRKQSIFSTIEDECDGSFKGKQIFKMSNKLELSYRDVRIDIIVKAISDGYNGKYGIPFRFNRTSIGSFIAKAEAEYRARINKY